MKDKINTGIIHVFCLLRRNCFHLGRAVGAPAKLLRTRLWLIDCFAFCVEPGRECRAIGGEHNACALCLWLILQGEGRACRGPFPPCGSPRGLAPPQPTVLRPMGKQLLCHWPSAGAVLQARPCAPQGRAMAKHLVRRFQKHQNCH